jgi:hypothetical protein
VLATRVLAAMAWSLLGAGLVVIALNPAVPSLRFSVSWLGVFALGRAAALILPWSAIAVDFVLFVVCFVGLEIGGLILWPSLAAFALADLLAS